MLFVAVMLKVITFSRTTSSALVRRKWLFRTARFMEAFRKTAMTPTTLPREVRIRCLAIPYLCRKPLSTSTLTSGDVLGTSRTAITAISMVKNSPLSPSIACRDPTWTRCLPPAASNVTTGGRTSGIRDTHAHVVMVMVFSRRGVSPTARKTEAGLLVLLTTLTEVVLPGPKFTNRVTKNAVVMFIRVVVFRSRACGVVSSGLKLARVFMFRKTTGGKTLVPTFSLT